jgi:hypothetical protein
MQTLGLSNPEPRSEGRFKSLFWPTIKTADDVDYLGTQGFWVCTLVAALSFVVGVLSGHALIGIVVLLFFYWGGVGVREHSHYAAAIVLALYIVDTLAAGSSVIRLGIGAVLFSNLRATWIASHWNPASNEAITPPRLRETWSDKFSDTIPMWLWPKVRVAFYVFSIAFVMLEAAGLGLLLRRRM